MNAYKTSYSIVCYSLSLLSFSHLHAQQPQSDIDQVRMIKISEQIIKMQILNDPNHKTENQILAELIMNSTQPQDTALVLNALPQNGIAQHLVEINTQGMVDEQKKRMTTELYKQIDFTSTMFKTCKVSGNIRQVSDHLYVVSISCQIPNPSAQALKIYHQQMAKFDPKIDIHEYKIQHFKYSHRIETSAAKQTYYSELLIDTSATPMYRPVIEDNAYFPNVIIDEVNHLFINRKVAMQRGQAVSASPKIP